MVGYNFDANNIQAVPIKNSRASTVVNAWQLIQDRFTVGGVKPNTWVLDNKASVLLKEAMKENETMYQIVPLNNHRTNISERAIQNFKNHSKA